MRASPKEPLRHLPEDLNEVPTAPKRAGSRASRQPKAMRLGRPSSNGLALALETCSCVLSSSHQSQGVKKSCEPLLSRLEGLASSSSLPGSQTPLSREISATIPLSLRHQIMFMRSIWPMAHRAGGLYTFRQHHCPSIDPSRLRLGSDSPRLLTVAFCAEFLAPLRIKQALTFLKQ